MFALEGQKLRELRMRLGISQAALAITSGLTRQGISLIERGLRQPTRATRLALEQALERLHLAQAVGVRVRGAFDTDEASREAIGRLQRMDLPELLELKVRLTPPSRVVDGLKVPLGPAQIVDGLQARSILRLFDSLFRVTLLPGWWTARDEMRVSGYWLEHKHLSHGEAEQHIIEQGPDE